MDDRVEAALLKAYPPSVFWAPQNYRIKLREGKHRKDKEMIFDLSKRRVVYLDHLEGERQDLNINEKTFDPLSSFYYIRTLKMEVGKPVFVDIADSKKLWNVEVQVLRKERITTKLGNFNTIVIRPLMKSEGIFNRKGEMYIWLTDDERRLPVKMQTKVVVGSVTATLAGGNY